MKNLSDIKILRNFALCMLILTLIAILIYPNISFAYESQWLITGHGYGHRVGMCQYGAQGMAESGKTVGEILAYYYQGTKIDKYPESGLRIKVCLSGSTATSGMFSKTTSGALAGIRFRNSSNSWKYELSLIPSNVEFRAYLEKGKIVLKKIETGKTTTIVTTETPLIAEPVGTDAYIGYKDRRYPGHLKITLNSTKDKIYVINDTDFETYIYGIAEMPSSWHLEALKAQAIAARTYAYRKIKSPRSTFFNVYDSVSDQVYIGMEKILGYMGSNWKKACDDTKNKIVYYGGEAAQTYYHSTCGGYTENSENVWSGALSYLRGVKCDYCQDSPHRNWSIVLSGSVIKERFGLPDVPMKINIEERMGKRVKTISFIMPDNSKIIKSFSESGIRSALGVKSAWFDIIRKLDAEIGSLPSYSTARTNSTSFTLYWGSKDPSAVSFDVQYRHHNSSSWKNLITNTQQKSIAFQGTQGSTYYFRVRARDSAGNTGSWSPVKLCTIPYDDTSRLFRLSGNYWSRINNISRFMGSSSSTSVRNQVFRLNTALYPYGLTGVKTLTLITTLRPDGGKANVYINGRLVKTVDTYSSSYKYRYPIVIKSYSSPAKIWDFRIVTTGTKNYKSKGYRVEIDGIAVIR